MVVNEPFGQRMRRLRQERGLTQTQLAAPSYTAAYVSTIEAGRRQPSPTAITHFADKFGVDPEELTTGRPSDLPAVLNLRLQEAHRELFSARYEKAEELFKSVAEEASLYPMGRIEAKAEIGLGIAAERRADIDQAQAHFTRAKELLENEPPHLQVETIAGLARCAQMQGNVRLSLHLLETYLLVLEQSNLPDPMALMRTNSSLIWPYSEVGLFKEAREVAEKALSFESRVEQPDQIASMHLNVARQLLHDGRVSDALVSLRRAEDLYAALNWRTETAMAHANRGIVLAEQGDLENARAALQTSLDMIEGTSDALVQARSLNELGKIERISGNKQSAIEILERSISLLRESDLAELALANHELGRCLTDDNPARAEKHFRDSVDQYERADLPLQAACVYRELGDLLSGAGDVERSREAYREGLLVVEPT